MIRLLVQSLAIAAVASSASVRYHMRGTQPDPGVQTCGAADRLADGRYAVVLNSDGAVVNGTPWKIEHRDAHGVTLSHHNAGAFVGMELVVSSDGAFGHVEIFGTDGNREECSDGAWLRGDYLPTSSPSAIHPGVPVKSLRSSSSSTSRS